MSAAGSTLRTLGALGLLGAAAPVNLAVTGVALLRHRPAVPPRAPDRRTVLLSGGKMTKALTLARAFHGAGHRVVLVEQGRYRLGGHRFSRAVDAFHVVPPPQDPGYAAALRRIAQRERVDVYVPVCSPASARFDALARRELDGVCDVLHPDAATVERLDDKHRFAELSASFGLAAPESHRITDPQQVADFDFAARPGRWVLKSLAYDPIRRLDLTALPRPEPGETAAFARALPISADNPWVLQRFVQGEEFCVHVTAREGAVRLYCCCRSSAFQVNYAMVEHPGIEAWVRTFVAGLRLTGQVSFDFIVADDGTPFAIECNPRTHSAITLFATHPGVAAAYLDEDGAELRPLPTARPTYWTYHELWRALSRPRSLPQRLRVLREGTDAVFDPADPLPFLLLHHLQIPSLLLHGLVRGRPWSRIDFNIGKLVQPAGD